jgi:integrase
VRSTARGIACQFKARCRDFAVTLEPGPVTATSFATVRHKNGDQSVTTVGRIQELNAVGRERRPRCESYFPLRRPEQSSVASRAFMVRILANRGVRPSEVCSLRIGQFDCTTLSPLASKSRRPRLTGVPVVEMSTDLAEALVARLDRIRRAGRPTGAWNHLVQTRWE